MFSVSLPLGEAIFYTSLEFTETRHVSH